MIANDTVYKTLMRVPASISRTGIESGSYDVQELVRREINFPPRLLPPQYDLKPTRGTAVITTRCEGLARNLYNDGTTYFGPGVYSQDLPLHPPFTDNLRGNVDASLRTKISNKSVSIAESIGEYQETLGLLHGAVNIVKDFWQLRKGHIPPRWAALTRKGLTRKWTFRDVSAAWIGNQFAVQPVIALMNDSLEQFRKPNVGMVEIPFKSTRKVRNDSIKWISSGYADKVCVVQSSELIYSHQLIIEYDSTIPSFSLGNPLEWVWAAIPFSFVLDWFLGVGNYFSQLNSLPSNTKILAGTDVLVQKRRAEMLLPPAAFNAGFAKIRFVKPSYREVFELVRDSNAKLAKPPLPRLHLASEDMASDLLVTTTALAHLILGSRH